MYPSNRMFIHARFSPEIKEFAIALIQGLKQSRYIVCKEQAHREHYHAAFDSPIGLEAIKVRFKNHCKSLGLVTKRGQENAYYGGVKECTDVTYVCKDGDVQVSAGYTTEELEALCQQGYDKYVKPKTDSASKDMIPDPSSMAKLEKKPKVDLDKFCNDIVSSIQCKVIHKEINCRKALELVSAAVLRSRFARVNDNIAFPLIQSCMWKLYPEEVEERFFDRVVKKFGYQY